MEWYHVVLAGVGGVVVGILSVYIFFIARVKHAQRMAEELLEESRREAERIRREAEISAKHELYRNKEAFEKEAQEIRQELKAFERRLLKKEDTLEKRLELLSAKEKLTEQMEAELAAEKKHLAAKLSEVNKLIERQMEQLQKIAGMSKEEATKLLLSRLEAELDQECARLIAKKCESAREVGEREARKIISLAIQRCAADHTVENVVSTIDLPSDDIKGRIIGREGRNIRAFEKATGVELIVDDTPGVVLVSGFDSLRREVAKRALEKLIKDGRIHPARIEEVVENTKKELDEILQESGKKACYELNIRGLHPRLEYLLGRLRYRTSFGQNVLQHSVEVANLCGLMAGELKLDQNMARRCGLLHDIGKAVDHEVEGGHPEIGADLARRFGEPPEVIHAISGHHGDMNGSSPYTVLASAADAISASRPGARRETFEKYIKRLERLEAIASSFDGVENSYAIQAGREVRVIVNASKVDDKLAEKVCRDIAMEIEKELDYPGEIKVTLIRETRVVEYAR